MCFRVNVISTIMTPLNADVIICMTPLVKRPPRDGNTGNTKKPLSETVNLVICHRAREQKICGGQFSFRVEMPLTESARGAFGVRAAVNQAAARFKGAQSRPRQTCLKGAEWHRMRVHQEREQEDVKFGCQIAMSSLDNTSLKITQIQGVSRVPPETINNSSKGQELFSEDHRST